MKSSIRGFHQDEDALWVAELSCGHAQHVRHDPPWQNRAWVTSATEREQMLGTSLDCPYCDMAQLPQGLTAYRRTESFSEGTVPAALLAEHRTKRGVWAQIVVEQGKLEYVCPQGTFVLHTGVLGIVEPEVMHQVRPLGRVRFHVVFLR